MNVWHCSKRTARGASRRLPEIAAAMAGGVAAVAYSDSDGEAPAAAPVRQSRRISGPGDAGSNRGRPGSGGGPHDAMLAGGVLAVRLFSKTRVCGCCCCWTDCCREQGCLPAGST